MPFWGPIPQSHPLCLPRKHAQLLVFLAHPFASACTLGPLVPQLRILGARWLFPKSTKGEPALKLDNTRYVHVHHSQIFSSQSSREMLRRESEQDGA